MYFVLVARYINEHRGHFLAGKPLGFQNRSGMYTDCTKPHFYDWRSSQVWLSSLVALLNAVLASVIVAVLMHVCPYRWAIVAAVGVVLLFAQLVTARAYLTSREGKTAERAAFGQERQ